MEKRLKTRIKKWGINGEGIAYKNRKPIFIDGALPGELVEYTLVQEKERYGLGHLEKVIEPAPARRDLLCAHAHACGGCALMHVRYKDQIKMKEQILKETLKKYAGYTKSFDRMQKNPDPLGYRNACKLPFGCKDGKLVNGFYEKGSNTFVGIDRCLIHSKVLEMTRQKIVEICNQYQCKPYHKKTKQGYRTLVLKEFDQKVQVIFVTGKETIPVDMIKEIESIDTVCSIWQSIKLDDQVHVFGEKMIHLGLDENIQLHLDDYMIQCLPRSFFQLNTAQAIEIYRTVKDWIPKSKTLVEAYSGVGAISLFCHDKAEEIIGIEMIQDAVDNANHNAQMNDIQNVEFICGDAAKELQRILKEKTVDILIVDPPRTGLDHAMKENIQKSSIETIVYISCNPSTLAKDLKDLERTYEIQKIKAFDMFSQTQNIETVVLLSRVK